MAITMELLANPRTNLRIAINGFSELNYNPVTGAITNPNPKAKSFYLKPTIDKNSKDNRLYFKVKRTGENSYSKLYIDDFMHNLLPEIFDKPFTVHLDGNPFNNKLSNLNPSYYSESFDQYIFDKIASGQEVTEQDFIEHPMVYLTDCNANMWRIKKPYVGNYEGTYNLFFDGVENYYCYEPSTGYIINIATNIVLTPMVNVINNINPTTKKQLPIYVFFKFKLDEENCQIKFEDNPDTTNFYKNISIHNIVKTLFPERFNKEYVRHINGNLFDNRLENLEPSDTSDLLSQEAFDRYSKEQNSEEVAEKNSEILEFIHSSNNYSVDDCVNAYKVLMTMAGKCNLQEALSPAEIKNLDTVLKWNM